MKRKVLLVALAAMLFFCVSQRTLAQSDDTRRVEIGAQFSVLHISDLRSITTIVPCVTTPCPPIVSTYDFSSTEPGFGGRIGYKITENVTLEAEGNFFPRDRPFERGRKSQGLFGVKAGKRFENVGVFGKARPGFITFSKGDFKPKPDSGCIAIVPPPVGCFDATSATEFAIDLGGVFEIYPSQRTIIRFDAGDTVIRFGERNVVVPSNTFPGGVVVRAPGETRHNFQGSVGIGVRF